MLIIAIIWLETISYDLYVSMIGMEKPVVANILLFARSALWIAPAAGMGFFSQQYRSLDVIFVSWLAGHLLSFAILAFHCRRFPIGAILAAPVNFHWLRSRIRRGWLIWISDVGYACGNYCDRYVIGALLGLSSAGLFTYYWSLSNAVQSLVSTAVVQVALPPLVKAFRDGTHEKWITGIIRELKLAGILAGSIALAVFFGSRAIGEALLLPSSWEGQQLLALILVATVIRILSDVLNIALTSAHRDRVFAIINIGGWALSTMCSCLSVWAFGLIGAGLGMFITAASLFLLRAWAVVMTAKRTQVSMVTS